MVKDTHQKRENMTAHYKTSYLLFFSCFWEHSRIGQCFSLTNNFWWKKWKETERWISAVGKCWQAAGCLQPWLVVKKNELKRMQELEIRGKKVRRFSLGTMTNSNQTTPVWSSCFKARWQKSCKEESSEPELQIAFRKATFFVIQLCHKHSHERL